MAEWKPNKKILEDLLQRYRHIGDKNEPLIERNGRAYSAWDLINELENRTEIGQERYESFLEQAYLQSITRRFYDRINITKKPGQNPDREDMPPPIYYDP